MNAEQFVAKWKSITLNEKQAAQQHYLDLCELLQFPKPADLDRTGESYTFEKGVRKSTGRPGFADIWKRGHFAWEYKAKGRDLDAAFNQLLQYIDDLENPPILAVCDTDRLIFKVRFTGYPTVTHEMALESLTEPKNLEFLRKVFHAPESLRPSETVESVTEKATRAFVEIAKSVQKRHPDATRFAHFLDRLVFCMFAEDVNLLPDRIFSAIFRDVSRDPRHINKAIRDLFSAMATGGEFWGHEVRCFDGALFDESPAMDLDATHFAGVKEAAAFDWSQMDVSIFGTLFERVMDPSQRSQLGAHYTGETDIATLIEPVVMAPLRREWEAVRTILDDLLPYQFDAGGVPEAEPVHDPVALGEAQAAVDAFLHRLRTVRVLDPACGSANFLYVSLRRLLDLEFEILRESRLRGLNIFEPQAGPQQLYGIEKNPYAHDLAQMTVWIGYLQWRREHGFPLDAEPVLQRLDNIRRMDAILDLTHPDLPAEPEWPEADFIVGNPPFLGGKVMRTGARSK